MQPKSQLDISMEIENSIVCHSENVGHIFVLSVEQCDDLRLLYYLWKIENRKLQLTLSWKGLEVAAITGYIYFNYQMARGAHNKSLIDVLLTDNLADTLQETTSISDQCKTNPVSIRWNQNRFPLSADKLFPRNIPSLVDHCGKASCYEMYTLQNASWEAASNICKHNNGQ